MKKEKVEPKDTSKGVNKQGVLEGDVLETERSEKAFKWGLITTASGFALTLISVGWSKLVETPLGWGHGFSSFLLLLGVFLLFAPIVALIIYVKHKNSDFYKMTLAPFGMDTYFFWSGMIFAISGLVVRMLEGVTGREATWQLPVALGGAGGCWLAGVIRGRKEDKEKKMRPAELTPEEEVRKMTEELEKVANSVAEYEKAESEGVKELYAKYSPEQARILAETLKNLVAETMRRKGLL